MCGVVVYKCVNVSVLFGVRARCGLPPAAPSFASWERHLQLWLRSLATLMFLGKFYISRGDCVLTPMYVAI